MNDLWKIKQEDKERALKLLRDAGIEVDTEVSTSYEHARDEIEIYLDTYEDKLRSSYEDLEINLTYEEYVESLQKLMNHAIETHESIFDEFYGRWGTLCDKYMKDVESIRNTHKNS